MFDRYKAQSGIEEGGEIEQRSLVFIYRRENRRAGNKGNVMKRERMDIITGNREEEKGRK